MIGHHVAVAAVGVVAIALGDALARRLPLAVARMPLAQIVIQPRDNRVARDEANGAVEQALDLGLDERLRFHRRQRLRAVDRLAVVADTRGATGQICGQLGVARRDHRPTVDEDLGADLLGHYRAVQRRRAALGRRCAVFQAQERRMLGGIAHAAPPQDRALLDQVVQPGLADLRRR